MKDFIFFNKKHLAGIASSLLEEDLSESEDEQREFLNRRSTKHFTTTTKELGDLAAEASRQAEMRRQISSTLAQKFAKQLSNSLRTSTSSFLAKQLRENMKVASKTA